MCSPAGEQLAFAVVDDFCGYVQLAYVALCVFGSVKEKANDCGRNLFTPECAAFCQLRFGSIAQLFNGFIHLCANSVY